MSLKHFSAKHLPYVGQRCLIIEVLAEDLVKKYTYRGKTYIQGQNVQTMKKSYGENAAWSVCVRCRLTECVGETQGRLPRQLDGVETTVLHSQHTTEQLATSLSLFLSLSHTLTHTRRDAMITVYFGTKGRKEGIITVSRLICIN